MGKITLVTGGARSGKSIFAEKLLENKDKVLYVATAQAFDNEMKERILKHQAQRNSKWDLLEAYNNLQEHLPEKLKDKDYMLIDCITIMVSNLMILDHCENWNQIKQHDLNKIENYVNNQINQLILLSKKFLGSTIIVTNELGMGIVPEAPLARYYRDIAGRVNQTLAANSDEVFLVVSGLSVKIK